MPGAISERHPRSACLSAHVRRPFREHRLLQPAGTGTPTGADPVESIAVSEHSGARRPAFGAPGIAPTWCSSDKDFVTTALGASRLWVTIGHGIINEIYWPSTGEPQVRDFGFYLVGANRWLDLKRLQRYHLVTPGPFLPLLSITHYGVDYRLVLEILPDPRRDVLLIRFELDGPYRLVVILAPHLGSTGRDNSAWVEHSVG